jgi:flagellar hook-basal body complex protein FliE
LNSINQLQARQLQTLPVSPAPRPGPAASEGPSFKNVLLDSIEQVNTMQQDANRAVEHLATGGDVSPAEVFTAVQKADLAFRMMMQVRNKLVQAYQEVQNVRV